MTEEKFKKLLKTKEIIDNTQSSLNGLGDIISDVTGPVREEYNLVISDPSHYFRVDLTGPHDNLEILEAVKGVLEKRLEHHKAMFKSM